MGSHGSEFVFGVDLDGCCADFNEGLRAIAAEWLGKEVDELPTEVSYGFPEWGIDGTIHKYEDLHRFAVTQRELFKVLNPMPGASVVLRRLSKQGIRIRIITHRLFIDFFHAVAVAQTIEWLDFHAFPYRDLCFMKDKRAADADLYLEDNRENIQALRDHGADVIVFANSTNRGLEGPRAETWVEVEEIVNQYWSQHTE